MCVPKEIPIITFSLWCTRLLASLCRYGQKVTLINKWVSYMPGKGLSVFKIIILLLLFLGLVQAMYHTNHSMKLGREIKLCDMTNTVTVMVKIM